mmetsp:Transcript_12200/g.37393  ORF Transcript_12200/g.37393 Transcript_12200/m.37393 type:complete len:320 (+) Transcript_12200:3823-4782(+)
MKHTNWANLTMQNSFTWPPSNSIPISHRPMHRSCAPTCRRCSQLRPIGPIRCATPRHASESSRTLRKDGRVSARLTQACICPTRLSRLSAAAWPLILRIPSHGTEFCSWRENEARSCRVQTAASRRRFHRAATVRRWEVCLPSREVCPPSLCIPPCLPPCRWPPLCQQSGPCWVRRLMHRKQSEPTRTRPQRLQLQLQPLLLHQARVHNTLQPAILHIARRNLARPWTLSVTQSDATRSFKLRRRQLFFPTALQLTQGYICTRRPSTMQSPASESIRNGQKATQGEVMLCKVWAGSMKPSTHTSVLSSSIHRTVSSLRV